MADAPPGPPLHVALVGFVADYRRDCRASVAATRAGLAIIDDGSPSDYYVYGLVDGATDLLFYVGKGCNGRWLIHYAEPPGACNREKRDRINAAPGPRAIVFLAGVDESDALETERALIESLAGYLTNVSGGTTSPRELAKAACREMLARYRAWSPRDPDTARVRNDVLAVLSGSP